MNKLIKKYLSDNYIIIGPIIMPFHYNDDSDSIQIFSTTLTNDLSKVFGLNRKELKWYIKGWIKNKSKRFDFNDWWMVENFNLSKYLQDLISTRFPDA